MSRLVAGVSRLPNAPHGVFTDVVVALPLQLNNEKVAGKTSLKSPPNDVNYGLSRSPANRVAAVEFLRRQAHGYVER